MYKISMLSIGAGAIGSYIGGRLLLSGQQVVFLEKPNVAESLQKVGLTIYQGKESQRVESLQVLSSLQQALSQEKAYDILLVAVKSYDTAKLIETLLPYKDHIPPILSLQNGVENEPQFRSAFGEERVIAGTVTSAIGWKQVGEIVIEKERGVGIATQTQSELALRLIHAFKQARFNVKGYASADALKWSKLITNQLTNATCAILRMPPAAVLSHPAGFQLEMLQIRETLKVMDALKIQVVDLPATPVRILVWAIRNLPFWLNQPLFVQFIGKGRGNKMPSLFLDLTAGKKQSEVEYLNGAVVRFGKKAAIDTPVNHFLNQTLSDIVQGKLSSQTYEHAPEKLLADCLNSAK
ncbi:MAG: 2-dehydropantoate 2-reductase [Anaerolineae bacterium]|jgi:2-dehydropantoate 2-reductase|nr:MAG: 2-dehydropantoate 2-reductase [Anaerolineae bacterium]